MKLLLAGNKYVDEMSLFRSVNTTVLVRRTYPINCFKQSVCGVQSICTQDVTYQFVILICRSLLKPLKSSVLKFTVIYDTNIRQDILTRLRLSCRHILPGPS